MYACMLEPLVIWMWASSKLEEDCTALGLTLCVRHLLSIGRTSAGVLFTQIIFTETASSLCSPNHTHRSLRRQLASLIRN